MDSIQQVAWSEEMKRMKRLEAEIHKSDSDGLHARWESAPDAVTSMLIGSRLTVRSSTIPLQQQVGHAGAYDGGHPSSA